MVGCAERDNPPGYKVAPGGLSLSYRCYLSASWWLMLVTVEQLWLAGIAPLGRLVTKNSFLCNWVQLQQTVAGHLTSFSFGVVVCPHVVGIRFLEHPSASAVPHDTA